MMKQPTRVKTKKGLDILLRLVQDRDEPLLKEFLYSVSDESLYHRFFTSKKKRLQERIDKFITADRTKEVSILATIKNDEDTEKIVGIGQYFLEEASPNAEIALIVQDEYQSLGIGTELVKCLFGIGKRKGICDFTAEVLAESTIRLHLFEKLGFEVSKRVYQNIYKIKLGEI